MVLANKRELTDVIPLNNIEGVLRDEGLMFNSGHPLYMWNPIIFETSTHYERESNTKALYQENIYKAFAECARRVHLYQVYGNGSAPIPKEQRERKTRINLIIPEILKEEWDHFAKETLKVSLSQMIRDAVQEYRNKYGSDDRVVSQASLQSMENRLREFMSEKVLDIVNEMKNKD